MPVCVQGRWGGHPLAVRTGRAPSFVCQCATMEAKGGGGMAAHLRALHSECGVVVCVCVCVCVCRCFGPRWGGRGAVPRAHSLPITGPRCHATPKTAKGHGGRHGTGTTGAGTPASNPRWVAALKTGESTKASTQLTFIRPYPPPPLSLRLCGPRAMLRCDIEGAEAKVLTPPPPFRGSPRPQGSRAHTGGAAVKVGGSVPGCGPPSAPSCRSDSGSDTYRSLPRGCTHPGGTQPLPFPGSLALCAGVMKTVCEAVPVTRASACDCR